MKIKEIGILLFFFVFSLSFAKKYNALDKVETFHFQVKEISDISQKTKEIHYEVFLKLPNQVKKILFYPEMNKGETYLYIGDEKTVYLPVFNQKTVSKIENEENEVLQSIKSLLEKLKSDIHFQKGYYNKEKMSLQLQDKYIAKIQDYIEVQGYLLPSVLFIEDDGEKTLELHLSNIQISPKLSKKDFEIP